MPINFDHTGNLVVTSDGLINFDMTGGVKVPIGTTAQRPGTPADGMLRYNNSLDKFEGYGSGAWQSLKTNTEFVPGELVGWFGGVNDVTLGQDAAYTFGTIFLDRVGFTWSATDTRILIPAGTWIIEAFVQVRLGSGGTNYSGGAYLYNQTDATNYPGLRGRSRELGGGSSTGGTWTKVTLASAKDHELRFERENAAYNSGIATVHGSPINQQIKIYAATA